MSLSNSQLNHLSVVPLYKQLKKILENEMNDGHLLPGDLLPSEIDICRHYGVSRVTVRTALQELADEGRLVRQRGKGTVVTQKRSKQLITFTHTSFTESCIASGLVPSRKLLSVSLEAATPLDCQALQLTEKDSVVVVRRILMAEHIPLILAIDHIRPEYSYLLNEDIEGQSLNALMRKSGFFTSFIPKERTLESIAADAELSSHLNVPMGQPMLLLYDVTGDESGHPLRMTHEYIAGDKVKYAYTL